MIRSTFATLVIVVCFGCQPADEITNYQVPSESRPVLAKIDSPAANASQGPKVMSRMLAAIIPNENRAWFVKAIGPLEQVAPMATQFSPFVQSIRFTSDGMPEWDLPDGWQATANKKSMRFATLKAKDVDVSISFLGYSGDRDDYLLRNINRWRGQVGLPDIALDRLAESTQTLDLSDGIKATLVDITGESAAGGPAMPPFAGGGGQGLPPSHPPLSNGSAPTSTADHDRPTASPDAAPKVAPGDVPPVAAGPPVANGPPVAAGPPVAGPAAKRDANGWQVPTDWTPGRMSSMRKAAYNVSKDGESAEVTVIGLVPSDVTANVNRWRGQIGLQPQSKSEVEDSIKQLTIDGTESQMVVLDGGEGKQSIAAVIVPKPDRMWFIKMTGDSKLVIEQVDAFEKFATSLTF